MAAHNPARRERCARADAGRRAGRKAGAFLTFAPAISIRRSRERRAGHSGQYAASGPAPERMGARSTQHRPPALPVVCRKKDVERPEWPIMSKDSWPKFSFTELLKPPDGWKTDHAVLCTYSADLVVIITSLLALSGCDLESRRTGTRVELVRAIEALRGRVRIWGSPAGSSGLAVRCKYLSCWTGSSRQ